MSELDKLHNELSNGPEAATWLGIVMVIAGAFCLGGADWGGAVLVALGIVFLWAGWSGLDE